jgi:hypothetical protein
VTSVLNDVITCRKNNSAFDLKKGHENLFYALTLLGYSSYESPHDYLQSILHFAIYF